MFYWKKYIWLFTVYFQLLTWLTSQFRRFLNEQNLRMLLFWCWVDWRSSSDGFSLRCKRPHSRVGSFKADSHTCLLVAESRHKRRFAESVHAGRHFIHIGEIFGMLSKSLFKSSKYHCHCIKSCSVFEITFLNSNCWIPPRNIFMYIGNEGIR